MLFCLTRLARKLYTRSCSSYNRNFIAADVLMPLKSLGFKYITIDLQGFRSGSLNEQLPDEQKRKVIAQ
jgi:PP-loop superfamily ATP-utilizing enzyme